MRLNRTNLLCPYGGSISTLRFLSTASSLFSSRFSFSCKSHGMNDMKCPDQESVATDDRGRAHASSLFQKGEVCTRNHSYDHMDPRRDRSHLGKDLHSRSKWVPKSTHLVRLTLFNITKGDINVLTYLPVLVHRLSGDRLHRIRKAS
jgi:hypothetical protein